MPLIERRVAPTLSSGIAHEAHRSAGIYEQLRLAIVTGELRPNEPLIEDALAEKLSVSRTPLRESIQRLAADGLLVPRKRGWAVREFTNTEIQENYEVRAGLEGLAARYAAERGLDAELKVISQIHKRRLAMKNPTNEERVQTNRDFHAAILTAAHNARLGEMIFNSGNFYLTRRVASQTNDDQYQRAQVEHAAIVKAILTRDGDAADAAMRAHIMNAFATWLRFHGE